MIVPSAKPISGASTMNTTVQPIPSHWSDDGPACMSAAPTRPPIKACDELVGNPQYQVRMSQKQAARSVAAMTRSLTIAGSMMPLPIVAATVNGKIRKAMKLKNAAQTTAVVGASTRVETTVATELAAS